MNKETINTAGATFATVGNLPSPSEFPAADIVIFDGNCRFCRASVNQLRWLDGKGRLAFVSLHDPAVVQQYPDLDHETLMAEMHLVDGEGRRHAGAASLKYLSRRLPKLWLLAPFMHIPCTMPLWRWIYGFIAKRRYRIAGRLRPDGCEDTCSVHFGK